MSNESENGEPEINWEYLAMRRNELDNSEPARVFCMICTREVGSFGEGWGRWPKTEFTCTDCY